MTSAKTLVFIPVGDNCQALSWIQPLTNLGACEIDFLLVYYGKDLRFQEKFTGSKIRVINDQSPSKFEKFHKYVSSGEINLDQYGKFWIADDDIKISPENAQKFIESFDNYNLEIAQPGCLGFAMGKQLVRRNPRYKIRFTNYVDGMAPLFSKNALVRCLETFENSGSGRGIDHVWAALLGNPVDKIAVVDRALMYHMNPSGANYSRFENTIDVQYQKIQDRYLSQVLEHYEWNHRETHDSVPSRQNEFISKFNPLINRICEIHQIGITRLISFMVARMIKNISSRKARNVSATE